MNTSKSQPKIDTSIERVDEIKLPPEFRSGNSIPVERATITRERMVEILAAAIEADRKRRGEPNDLMLSGVIRMPIDMAMASEISRLQFYQRAQQALNELEALQSQDREDAERYRWLREQCKKSKGGLVVCKVKDWELEPWSCDHLDQDIDHARRIEGVGK